MVDLKIIRRIQNNLQKSSRPNTRILWVFSIGSIAILGWLGYFWKLGSVGLVDETEPLFAEAARQMLVTGDWITPYFNGETRFDKPPLIYWLMAIAYRFVGVNEWGARLPSALAAIASVVFVAIALLKFGYSVKPFANIQNSSDRRDLLDWRSAWLGTGIAALTPLTIAWGRTGVSDMLLTACICGSMICFFHGYACIDCRRKQTYWYLAFYTCIGLGILTKGPVAIVLPGLAIGAFLLYVGRLIEVLREFALVRGLLLVSALAVPWFVAVSVIHGSSYIDSFFGYHNFERFTSVVNNHSAPWYFYFPIVLLGFAPFSIYLPSAIAWLRVWKRKDWRRQPRGAHLALFAFCWFVSIFLFFSVSVTKLPSYILPALPAAAILVALMWSDCFFPEREADSIPSIGWWIQISCNILFFVALAIASLFLTQLLGNDSAAPDLFSAIQAAKLPLWGGAIWGITAATAFALIVFSRTQWVCLTNIGGMLAFVILLVTLVFPLMDTQRQLPLRQLSLLAAEEIQVDEPMLMVGFMKPSVTFYMQRNIQYASGPSQFDRELSRWINAADPSQTGLVLGETDVIDELNLDPDSSQLVAEAGAYRLVRIELLSNGITTVQ